MPTTPRVALAAAGLPTVRIGGLAFRARVRRAYLRATEDLDLAVTLPRNQAVDNRLDLARSALRALGYRTDPFNAGPPGSDFVAFYGGRAPTKIDLFLNGVYDFDTRDDGRGTGCRIHVDDETERDLTRESLLLCKLVADRDMDREDAAALLLTGYDVQVLLRKLKTQVVCPVDGHRRIVGSLGTIGTRFGGDGPWHPTNPALDVQRQQVVAAAAALALAITVNR